MAYKSSKAETRTSNMMLLRKLIKAENHAEVYRHLQSREEKKGTET